MASLLPISAGSPTSVLEKPLRTAVAKGGYVCESTSLPSRWSLLWPYCSSRTWPFPQSASLAGHRHHITLMTRSFLWIEGPQHIFKYRSIPFFPWPLEAILSQQRHQLVIYLLWQSRDTRWLSPFFFRCMSHMTRQLSDRDLLN